MTNHQAFTVSFDEGRLPLEILLEGLVEDMDLGLLLPAEPVEPGARWSIGIEAMSRLLTPGGDLHLQNTTTGEGLREGRPPEGLQGTIRATYTGSEGDGPARLGRIELEIELDTSSDGPPRTSEEGTTITDHFQEKGHIVGELLWDLEHGHAARLELSGTTELRQESTRGGVTHTSGFSGTMQLQLVFTRE